MEEILHQFVDSFFRVFPIIYLTSQVVINGFLNHQQ